MAKLSAAITGVGGYVPEDKLTNEDLSKMVETSDEWITSRTGIKERRILKTPGWAASDMGVKVVEEICAKTGTDVSEIDMLICATITGDMPIPDTANTILDKVGAKNAFGFDVNAACSGFLYAHSIGTKFIESGSHKKVIVIGVDMMSSIIDYSERSICVIFGDGAGGVLLEPNTEGLGTIDSHLRSDGSGRAYIYRKGGGSLYPITENTLDSKDNYIVQDGRPVFKAAVNGMSSSIREVLKNNNLTNDDIKWLVPHQANKRIIKSVAENIDFPLKKVLINIEKYGNTTAATIPLCLWDFESKFEKGDNIVLTSFGGGFTWGATYLKWAY